MSSHVREGKDAAVATPAGVFAGCAEKDVALALEFGRGEPLGVQLDLVEGGGAADLVFGDEVDFAFALAVPPAAETGVAPGFGQLRGEIAFERETGEDAPVAPDERPQPVERAEFDRRAVPCDEAEPEVVEVVADCVAEVLGERFGEERLAAHDDLVVLLKSLEVAAKRPRANGVLDLPALGHAARDGGKDGEVDAVVLAEFLDERGLALFHENRAVANRRVDHLFGRDRAAVHQHCDILGDTAGDGVKGEQVGRGEGRVVGAKDPLQGRDGQRSDLEKRALPSEERLLVVAEDAVHQRVCAAADDQVDLRPGMELVPVALHLAEDCRIAPLEILELVDHQRQRMFARIDENPLEDVPKPALLPRQELPELVRDLLLEGCAEFLFAPTRHEEIQVGRTFKCLADQLGLADASASRHNGELRGFVGNGADLPQDADLFRASKEFHRNLPSYRNRGCRNRRSCSLESIAKRVAAGQVEGAAAIGEIETEKER